MNSSNDKPAPPAAQLNGFAPASGAGAGSVAPTGVVVAASASAGASAAVAAAATAGGGAGSADTKPAASAAIKKTKKRGPKKGGAAAAAAASASENDHSEETVLRPLSEVGSTTFEPLSLPQIQLRLKLLLDKLPEETLEVISNYDPTDGAAANAAAYAPVKAFASTIQTTVEEYNLVLSLVSSATYKWGVDRSGASQQNLSVMSAELQQCQDVISNVVSARLSNVLCPAVDVLIGEVEIVPPEGGEGNDGEGESASGQPAKKRKLNEDRLSANGSGSSNNERRINHYTRPLVDPSYVHLCHCILARNAPLLRHTVATSIHTAQRVIGDYLNAMKKDSGHEDSKGGYY